MDERDRGRVKALMDRMAGGDGSAVFELEREHGAELRRIVAADLRRFGAAPTREVLDVLTLDACLVIYDVAAGWRAEGGAPPWVWARARIRAMVASSVGIHAVNLDDEHVPDAAPLAASASRDEDDDVAVLRRLAVHDLRVGLLHEALEVVATERSTRILIELSVQRSLGDPSPATTVARTTGMKPDAVRQSVKRTRDRLRQLASADEAFAALHDLALLAREAS